MGGIEQMQLLHEVFDSQAARGLGGRFYGVYPATVSDISDPDGEGKVRVRLPWSPDSEGGVYEAWARLATMMAGNNRGSWFIPDVDDEVLVGFMAGDPRHPFVIGMLWNGQDQPPESMDGAGKNNLKVIRSRSGVKVTLDDSDGQENMVLETPGGQKMTMKDGPASIEVVDSNGNSIKLESSGITINSSAKVTISANQFAVSAGMVTIDAGISKFSAVAQADTVISNSVMSASYTPGAGNIW